MTQNWEKSEANETHKNSEAGLCKGHGAETCWGGSQLGPTIGDILQ